MPKKLTLGLIQKAENKKHCSRKERAENLTAINWPGMKRDALLFFFFYAAVSATSLSEYRKKQGHSWKTGSILVISFHPSWCQVHMHDTFWSFPPSPVPNIYQSCNPVVFAEQTIMCPWQRMKEKSTGIRFRCNCLLNCGLQLLKFYPWCCVTAAVMNSVWLWFSHWRHAHSELEKKMTGSWGQGLGSGTGGVVMKNGSREAKVFRAPDWGTGHTLSMFTLALRTCLVHWSEKFNYRMTSMSNSGAIADTITTIHFVGFDLFSRWPTTVRHTHSPKRLTNSLASRQLVRCWVINQTTSLFCTFSYKWDTHHPSWLHCVVTRILQVTAGTVSHQGSFESN